MQFGVQEAAVLRGLAAADPAGVVLRRMRTHDFCGAHVLPIYGAWSLLIEVLLVLFRLGIGIFYGVNLFRCAHYL